MNAKRLTRLTVIAPGIRRALTTQDAKERLPALERLLARGHCQRQPAVEPTFQTLEKWQLDVARVLRSEPLPSAPVSALGVELAPRTGTWLQAEFVHVAAGLDHLILVPLPAEQSLDVAAQIELSASLAAHLQEEGYEWLHARTDHFLHTANTLRIETCAPHAASRLAFADAMPRGADGARLRRLMTELQMQLHEHPVNQRRERAGLLAANAVWLWGAGVQPLALRSEGEIAWGQAYADDPYVRGLHRLCERECAAVPSNADALLNQAAGNALVLLHCTSLATLDSDWLAPLERALHGGRIEQLELILDDIHLSTDRWSRWRLWRRVLPVAEVFA